MTGGMNKNNSIRYIQNELALIYKLIQKLFSSQAIYFTL